MPSRNRTAASSGKGGRTDRYGTTETRGTTDKRAIMKRGGTMERRASGRQQPGGQRRTGRGRPQRVDKSRRKDAKAKLKGWLQTPADWARFTAWAKENALPKKIPEPEPIVRGPAKPLFKLRRRLKILALPRKVPDMSVHCRLEWKICKSALKVVASRRLILLALPNVRLCDYGRIYYKVSPAALRYIPSRRICELSQPIVHLPEECKPALMLCEKKQLDEERLRKLALAKKLLHCPQELTPEEIAELFTPYGTRRTALEYKITSWVEFLALPTYKRIKGRKDKNAVLWRKMIIEEGEERGKHALAEQKERERRQREKEQEKRGKRRGKKRKHQEMEKKETSGGDGDKKEAEEADKKTKEEKERRAKRRRIEKHAWRFVPHPCKDDPFSIKEAALKTQASPRVVELSQPNVHKNQSIRANPFVVRKGALSATATPRVESLAQPNRPLSPVKRKPPREKDKYGSPIFPKPVYGKRLPKTKPYKMGECPSKEKKKVIKKRPIDPIAYEPTYDPCIYPDWAKRQQRERKRAEKLSPKKRRKTRKQRKKQNKEKTQKEEETQKEEKTKNEEETQKTESQETEDESPAQEEQDE